MEQTLRELSGSIMGIASLDPKDFNIRAFDKVLMGEKEGIGVYYPMFRDGSCAEAEYFKFRTYPKYVITTSLFSGISLTLNIWIKRYK